MTARAERPDTIEIPVRNTAGHKADGKVGDPRKVRLAALQTVRNDKIHDQSGRADCAELDELPHAAALRELKQPSTNPQRARYRVPTAEAKTPRSRCWPPAARPTALRSRTSGRARGQTAACSSDWTCRAAP